MSNKSNKINEIKSLIIILTIVVISIFFMVIGGRGVELISANKVGWAIFLGYLIVALSLAILNSKLPNRILKTILIVFLIPLALIAAIAKLVIPVGTIIIHIMYILFLSAILPLIILKTNEWLHVVPLTKGTYTYILITSSTIIAVTFFKLLHEITYRIAPSRLRESKKMQRYRIIEIIDYVITIENIKFSIYALYLLFLILYSLRSLEAENLLSLQVQDMAILQSFLTFMAYDQLVNNSKELALLPSTILKRLSNSIFTGNNE